MKKALHILICLCLVAAFVTVAWGESKYATGSTSAAVTFAAKDQATVIKAIYAQTDKVAGAVKISSRTGSRAQPINVPTNGQQLIEISNASMAFTTNDAVVYQHADGTPDYTTLSDATSSNVTLTAGITIAGAAGDLLYEVTQDFQILVGETAGATNTLQTAGDAVYVSPSDSPVYIVVDGTGLSVISATRQ